MATYYVKPTGDDELDGSSWDNAWETVNKAATTATSGDTIYYADGTYDIGAGQTSWNLGLDNNIITHRALNSRLAIWENSENTSGSTTGSVSMVGLSYVTLDGIRIQSGGYYTINQIYVAGDSHHLEFHDVYCYSAADGNGMALRYCHDIMVDGCLISPESTTYGACEGIIIGSSGYPGVDIVIRYTEVSKTSHAGISIMHCDGVVIDTCLVHDTSSHCIDLDVDSEAGNYVDDVEITNCLLYDSGLWVSTDPSTHNKNAIYVAEGAQNIVIHHNDIFDHGLAALFVSSDADGPVDFHHNACYNCNLWDAEWVGDGYGYVHFYYLEAQTPTLTVKNNIFYITDQVRCRAYHVTDTALTNYFVADHNLLFAAVAADQRIRINGVSYTTFQSYLDAGYEANTVINDDPDFNDAANDDFTLEAGSPAIDQGTDLGYAYCGEPDIGAHEFWGLAVVGGVTPAGGLVRRVGKVLGGTV